MPAYNAEKTIEQSLGSLIAQARPRKFILTVVDDASTDDTLNIVEDFKKFIPIKIISLTENKGVANARQVGLDNCECDLVAFLDSDDKFMPYTIAMYNREMKIDTPDVLYSDFISEQQGREVLIAGKHSITWFHGKVYRKSFLDNFGIKMPPVRYNEDAGFSTIVHEITERRAYIPEISYYWSANPESLTRSNEDFNIKSMGDFVRSIQFALNHLKKYQNIYAKGTFYFQLNNMYNYYMEALYNKVSWIVDIEMAQRVFFKDLWIEKEIRPQKIVEGFTAQPPNHGAFLKEITPVQWLSKMSGIDYTVEDFRTEKKEKSLKDLFNFKEK